MHHIVFILFLLLSSFSSYGQIRVSLLTNVDSNSNSLGSGFDNKIKVYGLPLGVELKLNHGTVMPVGGNEFVLCRFGEAKDDQLRVVRNGRVLFTKLYRVHHTHYSGTIYNPAMSLRAGNLLIPTSGNSAASVLSLTKNELLTDFSNWFHVENDTNFTVIGLQISILPPHKDLIGPYIIGCGNNYDTEPVPSLKERLECDTHELLKYLKDVNPGDKIFLEEITADYRIGKQIFIIGSIAIKVR